MYAKGRLSVVIVDDDQVGKATRVSAYTTHKADVGQGSKRRAVAFVIVRH